MNLLSVETRNEVCVITPRGDSLSTRDNLDELSRETHAIPVGSDVIVDLANVSRDYQEWVGALIAMHRLVTAAGYKMVVFGSRNGMAEKLAITRIDKIITLVETEAEALAEVSV
ncbi:MAG: hypothetical protein KDD66_14080 [Bdellovibrionales bacterium]|nr:hypothetical protein [Bdellovibrionales bacterium]